MLRRVYYRHFDYGHVRFDEYTWDMTQVKTN